MGSKKHTVKDWLVWGMLSLSLIMLLWATTINKVSGDTDQAAKRMGRILEEKSAVLDTFVNMAMEGNRYEWMELEGLPSDMVVYRYVDDTLQSWNHTFTVASDEVSSRLMFQRLANPKNGVSSPFIELTGSLSFQNFGQNWYLIKSVADHGCRIIAGIEVMNEMDSRSNNHVNPSLRLNDKFSINPISSSGGSTVYVQGLPQFKIIQDSLKSSTMADSNLVWLALLIFVAALLLAISNRRSLNKFWVLMPCIVIAMISMFGWGHKIQNDVYLFSPSLYADGPVLFSLGAVVIINVAILAFVISVYLVRNEFFRYAASRPRKLLTLGVMSALVLLTAVGILLYTNKAFSSIVLNSNICLELYKFNDLSVYSALVYVSFVSMLVSIPLLAQMLRPFVKETAGLRFDAFSGVGRTVFALALGVYFVLTAALLGFTKEQNRVDVWANRLSVERDIALELQLRRIEPQIANDIFIATLSALPNASNIIMNRIVDSYMYSISQDYDISVVLMGQDDDDPPVKALITEAMRSSTRINDSSRFLYSNSITGYPTYFGLFTYFNPRYGAAYMMLQVDPKSSREYGGYSSLLGITAPGQVALPTTYSYAKYKESKLTGYKGNFAYPTFMSDDVSRNLQKGSFSFVSDGFIHFVNVIEDDETVIISRKRERASSYVIGSIFLALLAFMIFSLPALTRRRKRIFEKTYYKNRISSVLMISLIVTLITMATVSIFFVYERNDANKNEMMSDKINSIQVLLSDSFRFVDDYRQLNSQELTTLMDDIGKMSKVDITLYSPQGKAFKSTAREVFDRMLISDRINDEAFNNIVYKHRRYYIHRESVGQKKYYALYAPLFNNRGNMVAILCTPYVDMGYDFEMEAVMHSVTIFTVFIILMLLARFMSGTVVDKMFKPIVQIGRRMNRTSIDNLEYIDYDRDDEISTLVKAYNMMVSDLAESTKQLAQAERDKAWSSMARQVAHEIKNPLTPMKLQMQRLIRLKQRNAPGWEDKFDEVSKVVLDHIDILSDTANEFSTFAKLYTEKSVEIDLDALLQEEISMFDNREGIEFVYYGMENATVMGPKPQLTRVFVNLMTNSVQAIDIQRQEMKDSGDEPAAGRVVVSLRNSSQDGYYDIVFEDNGPGVSEENQSKLFTPNFTTKSAGTGLGLSICRSILEKCSASISYSKSFALEGACFTIRYPKMQA
ncbi:MAG: ATP-binding protein [Bacteroidia bacterium]|nr:ATP-binding protein [Bacteroidia bacterium]